MLVTLRIKVSPKRRDDMIEIGRLLVGRTRALPGCINCGFYQDVSDPDAALLIQEWSSEETMVRYICSDDYRKVLALIDFSSEYPDIKFNTVLQTAGMEAIRSARTQGISHEAIP